MTFTEARRVLRTWTMGCWWAGPVTDWEGILGEVRVLQEGIRMRQGIDATASFYALDDDNPETADHDQLAEAYACVIAKHRLPHKKRD